MLRPRRRSRRVRIHRVMAARTAALRGSYPISYRNNQRQHDAESRDKGKTRRSLVLPTRPKYADYNDKTKQ